MHHIHSLLFKEDEDQVKSLYTDQQKKPTGNTEL